MIPEINFAQAFVGAILGLLLGSLLSDTLKKIWSSIGQIITIRKVRRIAGFWRTNYWYFNENGEKIEHSDTIRLTQRGIYVFGENEGDSDHEYEMQGQFQNEIVITGKWKSSKPEVVYHGAFQLVATANGRRMAGRWLGLTNEHLIQHGEWQWEWIRP